MSIAPPPGYFDWAAFGPLSPAVRTALASALDDAASFTPEAAGRRAGLAAVARAAVAALLGVGVEGVTLHPTATQAFMHVFFALRGDVLVSSADFPAITVPLARASALGLTRAHHLPRNNDISSTIVTPDAIARHLHEEVRAVAVSAVDFRTGARVSIAALRDVMGPDRLLVVDATHAIGVIDEPWHLADVVVGHGYKWLRAERGTAFAWLSERMIDRMQPTLSGRTGGDGARLPLDHVPPAALDARALSTAPEDTLAAARLAAAATDARTHGVAATERHVAERVERIFDLLAGVDVVPVTPRAMSQRAGIVSVCGDDTPLAGALRAGGVQCTIGRGLVRLAPFTETNDDEFLTLERALAALRR